MRFSFLLLALLATLAYSCFMAFPDGATPQQRAFAASDKIKGLNFVAPRRPLTDTAMAQVKAVRADWIAVIPYGFTNPAAPGLRFHKELPGWWGETPEGVRVTTDSAHRMGLKVMVKPQVWIRGGWIGSLDFATDAEWQAWEKDYEDYIMTFAETARQTNADMFCIGTECKIAVVKREAFWRALIAKVRSVYSGPLTYAANWDEYAQVPFWDALDKVGIDAYFPLLQGDTPEVEALCAAWKPTKDQIEAFHRKTGKPIVFTEYGYLDTDGCAWNTWELEKRLKEVNLNQKAQANATEALLRVFSAEPWWQGGFVWKWYPEMRGPRERDYSPQYKQAETILQRWYGGE